MKGMIAREVKRTKLRKQCGDNHDFTDQPFRDPADRRVMLCPRIVQFGDKDYHMLMCRKCGVGKFMDKEQSQ